MKSVYLETAAFFKIFIEEEGSEDTEKLIQLAKAKKIRIILSDWVINETIALLEENRRTGKISTQETQLILSEIIAMVEGQVEYSHFTFFAITEAVVLASRLTIQDVNISASDALHVYIAHNSGCHYFVTGRDPIAERVFDASVRHDGDINFKVYDVRNAGEMTKLLKDLS